MVHPVLTVLFDLFLIGSALAVIAAMVSEYVRSRTPSVGSRPPRLTELGDRYHPRPRRPLRTTASSSTAIGRGRRQQTFQFRF